MSCHRHVGAPKRITSAPIEPTASPITVKSPELTRRMMKYLKLIALYKDHECLWHQCHTDFFNLPLREKVWQEIAGKMKKGSDAEQWKNLMYKLRYSVELERIQQQAAKFQPDIDLAPKLQYGDKMQFLNHMFDRKWCKSPFCTKTSTPRRSECFMLLSDSTGLTSYARKLKALENLRNKCSPYVLSPEAFRKVQTLLEERELPAYP
ncbi:uncharacterized protein [Drosophila pseudoobscura]|uniref:Uncharacterized protein isoform X1 n=1 Tax=Drosophila pseudoobscura pseudoobscura TaxID=46245 RepID=A0A6I8ULP0_DROPS|nr:uncharacterized protein LOC4818178 isoform X1 [Drosophila pseudoobscura]